jgi:hypothetical protein
LKESTGTKLKTMPTLSDFLPTKSYVPWLDPDRPVWLNPDGFTHLENGKEISFSVALKENVDCGSAPRLWMQDGRMMRDDEIAARILVMLMAFQTARATKVERKAWLEDLAEDPASAPLFCADWAIEMYYQRRAA